MKNIIIIILFSLLLFSGAFFFPKLKKFLYSETTFNRLEKLKLLKRTCTSDDLDEYIAQEGFDFEKENKRIIENSLKKLYGIKNSENLKDSRIPFISHRIYITPPGQSKHLNNLHTQIIVASLTKLNKERGWNHFFWTNSPEIIPEELTKIPGLEIRYISEFKDHKLYATLLEQIQKTSNMSGYFASSTDLLRYIVLQKYGGVYADNDYEIFNAKFLISLMNNFNFLAPVGINKWYENAFIASSPNHPILNRAIELEARNNYVSRNLEIPYCIKYAIDDYRRIYFSGPPLLTASILFGYDKDGNNDLLLPHWLSMNPSLAQYKNGNCNSYNKFTKEDFIRSEQNLDSIIIKYTELAKISEYTVYDKFKPLKPYQQNIFYDPKYFSDFEIIGADMSCGSWTTDPKGFNRIYYWQWPFSDTK